MSKHHYRGQKVLSFVLFSMLHSCMNNTKSSEVQQEVFAFYTRLLDCGFSPKALDTRFMASFVEHLNAQTLKSEDFVLNLMLVCIHSSAFILVFCSSTSSGPKCLPNPSSQRISSLIWRNTSMSTINWY